MSLRATQARYDYCSLFPGQVSCGLVFADVQAELERMAKRRGKGAFEATIDAGTRARSEDIGDAIKALQSGSTLKYLEHRRRSGLWLDRHQMGICHLSSLVTAIV